MLNKERVTDKILFDPRFEASGLGITPVKSNRSNYEENIIQRRESQYRNRRT
jgi:hypothetical protein